MNLLHSITMEALAELDSIIAAWDEPHRGDLDMARDTMFDPIERARRFRDHVDGMLKVRGLMARPPARNGGVYRRVFHGD